MNLEYFGLTRRPFLAEPSPEGFCSTGPVESAREEVSRCIHRMEGVSLITGDSGCGKTLLCRVLAKQFESELDVAVLCGRNLCSAKTLFQMILAQIGIPYRHRDENELRISVFDYLSLPEYSLRGLLIIVDEAHTLRLRILEELRQLIDSVFTTRSGVRLVLVGTPALEEKLTHPRLNAFSQRITTRCFLEALNRLETEEFLRSQIISCGGKITLFTKEVCREIHRLTQGVPRVVHQLADHILLTAYDQRQKRINTELVLKAWKSLQQIAESESSKEAGWEKNSEQENFNAEEFSTFLKENAKSPETPPDDTVEFGALEEEKEPTETFPRKSDYHAVRKLAEKASLLCNDYSQEEEDADEYIADENLKFLTEREIRALFDNENTAECVKEEKKNEDAESIFRVRESTVSVKEEKKKEKAERVFPVRESTVSVTDEKKNEDVESIFRVRESAASVKEEEKEENDEGVFCVWESVADVMAENKNENAENVFCVWIPPASAREENENENAGSVNTRNINVRSEMRKEESPPKITGEEEADSERTRRRNGVREIRRVRDSAKTQRICEWEKRQDECRPEKKHKKHESERTQEEYEEYKERKKRLIRKKRGNPLHSRETEKDTETKKSSGRDERKPIHVSEKDSETRKSSERSKRKPIHASEKDLETRKPSERGERKPVHVSEKDSETRKSSGRGERKPVHVKIYKIGEHQEPEVREKRKKSRKPLRERIVYEEPLYENLSQESVLPLRAPERAEPTDTDGMISQAYLENAVHGFSRLHSMLEAILEEASKRGEKPGPPSAMWRKLQKMTGRVMDLLVHERFDASASETKTFSSGGRPGEMNGHECPLAHISAIRPDFKTFSEPAGHSSAGHSRILEMLEIIQERLSALKSQEAKKSEDAKKSVPEKRNTKTKTTSVRKTAVKNSGGAKPSAKNATSKTRETKKKISPKKSPGFATSASETAGFQPKSLLEDENFARILEELDFQKRYRLDGLENPEFGPINYDFLPETRDSSENHILRDYLHRYQMDHQQDTEFSDWFYKILSQLKMLEMEE